MLGAREKPITSWFKTASNLVSDNTIDIALVRTDGGRVWLVAGGHVVTILSMGTRIRENGRCQRRSVAVNEDSWQQSGRSCYDWHADLLGRCWVRLDCNGGFKGWSTTLNPWPFCVMSAPSMVCAVIYAKGFWWR